jgi:hypothetical protein
MEEPAPYFKILPVFDDFGYHKDQQKWKDKLRDTEIDTLVKLLCSRIGGRAQFRYGLVEVCHAKSVKF